MKLQVVKPEANVTSLLGRISTSRTQCTIGNADVVYATEQGDNSYSRIAAVSAAVSAGAAVVAVAISLKIKSKDLLIGER